MNNEKLNPYLTPMHMTLEEFLLYDMDYIAGIIDCRWYLKPRKAEACGPRPSKFNNTDAYYAGYTSQVNSAFMEVDHVPSRNYSEVYLRASRTKRIIKLKGDLKDFIQSHDYVIQKASEIIAARSSISMDYYSELVETIKRKGASSEIINTGKDYGLMDAYIGLDNVQERLWYYDGRKGNNIRPTQSLNLIRSYTSGKEDLQQDNKIRKQGKTLWYNLGFDKASSSGITGSKGFLFKVIDLPRNFTSDYTAGVDTFLRSGDQVYTKYNLNNEESGPETYDHDWSHKSYDDKIDDISSRLSEVNRKIDKLSSIFGNKDENNE